MDISLTTPSWDDQGLWFALLFNLVVGALLFGASVFLLFAPVLWTRRLFRTNHTVLSGAELESPDAFERPAAVKRVGLALRHRCSLFALPTWRDWLSVEESVPHLERVFHSSVQPSLSEESLCVMRDRYERDLGVLDDTEPEVSSENVLIGASALQQERTRTPKKVPLDPQVALYISFLKLCASMFIIGAFFTVWICALSGTDDYMVRYAVERDIHNCSAEFRNQTGCTAKAPHCQFVDKVGCFAVPMRGLDDLSTLNITPRSWRLWLVALFDMCFCVVYAVCMVFFLHRVDAYIAVVMRMQMERSLGHRVVVVRGLRSEETLSQNTFKNRFLSESAYFPPQQSYSSDSAASSEGQNDEAYYRCEYTGFDCLFSAVGFNRYKSTRADTIFTRESELEQLLFPRIPPHRMYSYMDKAENSIEALEEALADQKEHIRRLEKKSRSEENNHDSPNNEDKVLMIRRPFPSCCSKMPKVEYCKNAFRKQAMRLNRRIDEVSQSQAKGSAFVVFRNPLAAYQFVHLFGSRSGILSKRRATIAGLPGKIIQMNISANRYFDWLRALVVLFAFVLLLFFWSIPVGFLGSLDNIAQVPGIGETFKKYYSRVPEALRDIISAFLPVLVLAIFNIVLPYIIRGFVVAMGAVNQRERDGGALYLQYLFMLLTGVIFQAALQGGLSQIGDLLADTSGDSIVNFFVAVVSPRGGYWYAKILSAACLSTWMELIDPLPLIIVILRRKWVSVQRVYDSLFRPCDFRWTERYSFDLTILAMGLLFRMTAPLLTLFVGLYFILCYMTQRCRLYDRYRPGTSPEEDCTNFAASVQVIRAVSWLYCLGGTGNVLLMSLRDHVGGVVCCSVTLAASILFLVYVHVFTRRWVASLAHARKFFIDRVTSETVYGTSFDSNREAAESPLPRGASAREGEVRRRGQTRMSLAAPPVALLPQRACVESLYQPRHQRLVRIQIGREIERLERTVFHVNRYWDGAFEEVDENAAHGRTAAEDIIKVCTGTNQKEIDPRPVVAVGQENADAEVGEDTKRVEKEE